MHLFNLFSMSINVVRWWWWWWPLCFTQSHEREVYGDGGGNSNASIFVCLLPCAAPYIMKANLRSHRDLTFSELSSDDNDDGRTPHIRSGCLRNIINKWEFLWGVLKSICAYTLLIRADAYWKFVAEWTNKNYNLWSSRLVSFKLLYG